MFRTISEFKNAYLARNFIIVGTGPSADYLDFVIKNYERKGLSPIVITINRALALYSHVDFAFLDTDFTFQKVRIHLSNAKYICIPIWANKRLAINSEIVQQNKAKVLLFAWAYKNYKLLEDTEEYSLDDFQLFIQWGNSQSALHFARRCGAKSVLFVGCEGIGKDGRVYASILNNHYKMRVRRFKQLKNYKESREGLEHMIKLFGITAGFIESADDAMKFINALY